ncbi:MAG: anti-sigma regulatory factor [Synechococcales bacterium]|nr:anti-sigma regulatory factor [Synechococcales bacterium]
MPLTFSQQASLQTPTDLNALAQVLTWFDQFRASKMPPPIWLQCQLALAEGFTNAVRHAHRGLPVDTPIDIEVKVGDHCSEIRIWDYGPGFDFDDYLAHASDRVDKNAEGGRGLGLMKQISSSLSYSRIDDQRNCLLLIKYYAEAHQPPAAVDR